VPVGEALELLGSSERVEEESGARWISGTVWK
jgi:hypothetical protein